jgi:hypothetical protein
LILSLRIIYDIIFDKDIIHNKTCTYDYEVKYVDAALSKLPENIVGICMIT